MKKFSKEALEVIATLREGLSALLAEYQKVKEDNRKVRIGWRDDLEKGSGRIRHLEKEKNDLQEEKKTLLTKIAGLNHRVFRLEKELGRRHVFLILLVIAYLFQLVYILFFQSSPSVEPPFIQEFDDAGIIDTGEEESSDSDSALFEYGTTPKMVLTTAPVFEAETEIVDSWEVSAVGPVEMPKFNPVPLLQKTATVKETVAPSSVSSPVKRFILPKKKAEDTDTEEMPKCWTRDKMVFITTYDEPDSDSCTDSSGSD